MISRRQVITGGALSGVTAAAPTAAAAPAQELDTALVVKALGEIAGELRRARTSCSGTDCPAIEAIRSQQSAFLRTHQKYPDFLEIGTEIWEDLWDWQVRNQQPVTVRQLPDGRYAMPFRLTTIVLRPDLSANYVGQPYDSR